MKLRNGSAVWVSGLFFLLTFSHPTFGQPDSNQQQFQINSTQWAVTCGKDRLAGKKNVEWNDVCYVTPLSGEKQTSEPSDPKPTQHVQSGSPSSKKRSLSISVDGQGNVTQKNKKPAAASASTVVSTPEVSPKAVTSDIPARKKDASLKKAVSVSSKKEKKADLPSYSILGEESRKRLDQSGPTSYLLELFNRDNPLTKFEFGFETYSYEYIEPDFASDEGYYWGITATQTYRWSTNSYFKSLKDIFSDENKINVFKLDFRYAFGQVDYDGSGTVENIDDYVLEPRGLFGYDIPINEDWMVTPYFGFGFRYLVNHLDEAPEQVIGDQAIWSGYERESRYFYSPLQVEVNRKINQGELRLTLEYDFFWGGEQRSYLGDGHFAGVQSGYDTAVDQQDDGYGLRSSLKYTKFSDRFDFFFEPFVRYWNIEDSNWTPVTKNGALEVSEDDPELVLGGLEPANTTTEYGFKIGINY